jgi:hypothetical protein
MKYLLGIVLLFINFSSMAASINLYETPKDDAKILGTINSDTGIVPIFFSENSAWVKVGDPTNGNAGWVKAGDLGFQNSVIGFTFSDRDFNSMIPTQTYNLTMGATQNMNGEETVAYLKAMHLKQATIQQALRDMITLLFKDQNLKFPVLMPVLFIPDKNLPLKNPNDALSH